MKQLKLRNWSANGCKMNPHMLKMVADDWCVWPLVDDLLEAALIFNVSVLLIGSIKSTGCRRCNSAEEQKATAANRSDSPPPLLQERKLQFVCFTWSLLSVLPVSVRTNWVSVWERAGKGDKGWSLFPETESISNLVELGFRKRLVFLFPSESRSSGLKVLSVLPQSAVWGMFVLWFTQHVSSDVSKLAAQKQLWRQDFTDTLSSTFARHPRVFELSERKVNC